MSRVLLIGLGPTTATALDSLAERFTLAGVVRPADHQDPVIRAAMQKGIPLFFDTSMRGVEKLVERLEPDAVVVSSYDRILRPALLARCPFVNVHYAPLPRYRGRATVNWAIINGESSAAISIHVLAPELDGGDILHQEEVPIGPADTVSDLYARLNDVQRRELGRTVEAYLNGRPGSVQDPSGATYGCTRLPRDGEIDWSMPTARIDALIRALTPPFPGAFTYLNGRKVTVWRATPSPAAPVYVGRIPGRVALVSKREGWVDVLTGDGVLRLFDVQADGEAMAPASSVVTSVKATLGLGAAELLERVRALEQQVADLTDTVQSLRELMPIHVFHGGVR